MGFTYSNKLFGGTGSGAGTIAPGGLTAGRVALSYDADSVTDSADLAFNDTTNVLTSGAVTAKNVTASGLATPGGITVTPVLSQVGAITVVGPAVRATGLLTVPAAASLSDTETFSIHDGSSQQGFEFDTNSAVVNVGFVPVDLTGLTTAEDVAAACASAINGATGPGWTVEAIDNLDGTVTLRNTAFGAAGNAANAEAVGDVGFILTNMTGGADGIIDGDALSVGDGTGIVPIEFDFAPGDGTTGGAVAVIYDETDTATTLRDAVKAVLDAAGRDWTTSAQGADGIGIVRATPGATGGAITEDVTDAGFTVTDWTDPTHATTYTYRIVWRLPDGSTTEGGAASSTALGVATLTTSNYNALSWAAGPAGTVTDVYRTVGGATQGKIATGLTVTSLNDTGLAGGGETAPTVDDTGVLWGDGLRIGTSAVAGHVLTADANGYYTAQAGGGGVTNSAGANVLAKSDGTNLVASSVTDDGTVVTVNTRTTARATILTDGTGPALGVTATLPASPSATAAGVAVAMTGAGSAAQAQYATHSVLAAGYTGGSANVAVVGDNLSAGTGVGTASSVGVLGMSRGNAASAVGVTGRVINGTPTRGTGVLGLAAGGTHRIAVVGNTVLAGTSAYGGLFSLNSSESPVFPTTGSAALVADNNATTSSILQARDNGVVTFDVADGGVLASTWGNGAALTTATATEQVTLDTGDAETVTAGNLAPANAIIEAILYRITTQVATATAFEIKVTGGNSFVNIGTATASQTTLAAGTTGVLVPAAFGDQYNDTATTLTITTTGTPSAGVIRLTVVYRAFTPPTS
jgi:hypothetical protein